MSVGMRVRKKGKSIAGKRVSDLPAGQRQAVMDELDRVTAFLENEQSAFKVGAYLCNLHDHWDVSKYEVPFSTFEIELDNRSDLRGRKKRMRAFLKAFSRIYSAYPLDQVSAISDKYARALAQNYRGRVSGFMPLDPGQFNYPPDVALQIAIEERHTAEVLESILDGSQVPGTGFSSEDDLLSFLMEDDFLVRKLGCTEFYVEPSLEWTGSPDFVGVLGSELLVVEVEYMAASSNDVGQLLGFLGELDARRTRDGYRLTSESRRAYISSGQPKIHRIQAEKSSGWMIAESFNRSAYFSARGQTLSFCRVARNGNFAGPLKTQYATEEDWDKFVDLDLT